MRSEKSLFFFLSTFLLLTFTFIKGFNMKRDLPDRSFQFAVRIIRLCQHLDEKCGISRVLMNQLLRSGTSIGANIEEGQAGQSEK